MNKRICNNCGYFDTEDQKCYYFVDQYIYFNGKPAEPMNTQPDDDGCEKWQAVEE